MKKNPTGWKVVTVGSPGWNPTVENRSSLTFFRFGPAYDLMMRISRNDPKFRVWMERVDPR